MSRDRTVLAVDVGGSHVKLLTSAESEPRRFDSGPELTPEQLLEGVRTAADGWSWDVVTLGIQWKRAVFDVVDRLSAALEPDYVVIGGGGVEHLDELPENARRGANENAFAGGFRLWDPEWSPRLATI